MREVDEIILHCTATPQGRDVSAADVRRWHVNGNGWSDIGYHFVLRLDGTIETGRPLERIGAHVRGRNASSVGIAYVGGLGLDMEPCDTMTDAQEMALEDLVEELRQRFGFIPVTGHNDYSQKACPSFRVSAKYPRINEQ
jgi:N-acetylmuramoyl-L-alanine amidase